MSGSSTKTSQVMQPPVVNEAVSTFFLTLIHNDSSWALLKQFLLYLSEGKPGLGPDVQKRYLGKMQGSTGSLIRGCHGSHTWRSLV